MKKSIFLSSVLALVLGVTNVSASTETPQSDPDNPYSQMGWQWVTTNTTVTSPYGWRTINGVQEFHKGFDIGVYLQDVTAAQTGTIMSAGTFSDGAMYIALETNNVDPTSGKKLVARYLHLSSKLVSTGQSVNNGVKIGVSGNTGGVPYHLHFDVNNAGTYNGGQMDQYNTINPTRFWPYMFTSAYTADNQTIEESTQEELDIDNPEYYFEDSLINYVESAKFNSWFNSLEQKDRTLTNFKKYFKLTDEKVAEIQAAVRR